MKLLPLRSVKRIIIISALILVSFIYIPNRHHINARTYYYIYPKKSIQCYHIQENTLADITDGDPPPGKSIFFHETSCNSHYNGKIYISARQACAVESAAKYNPNFTVYLLFASPGLIRFNATQSDRMLQVLLRYNNIVMRHVNLNKYTKGTPVEELYRKGELDLSGYAQSHASDILRYLSLWRYGGIYLDLDVIVTKSLENLALNYGGSESDRNVAAGVLSFDPTGQGHKLARRCLDDLKLNFRGHEWGHNGPGVITRLLRRTCGVDEAKDMIDKDCEGFKVYPPEYFYPVRWQDWEKYFDEGSVEEVACKSKNSYVVHVWNKHSVDTKIPVGSKVPYTVLAQEHCPNVFKECDDYF